MTEDQKAHNWIMAIIDSCTNTFHFEGADILIELYQDKYNNVNMYMALLDQRQTHYNNIHGILISH